MIKIKIPQLLEKNNMTATDLFRKGNIAYQTAFRLSKGKAFEVLENLCALFDVGVDEILEYVPEKKK